MAKMAAFVSALILITGTSACRTRRDSTGSREAGPGVVTSDVHNFVTAFAGWTRSDTSCRSLDRYLDAGSPGLETYRAKFDMGRTDLCSAVRRDSSRYAALQSKMPGIDSAQRTIEGAFVKFAALVPGAVLPRVYFVVGDEIWGGTTTGGDDPIVLVGAERLGSLTDLPVLTVHELVHTQQHYPIFKVITGGPGFIRGTVLAQSIKEGSADFLAELATGQIAAPGRDAYGDAHEEQIWHDFQHDMHERDYSRWIYNGWNQKALGDRPADLGYYVGYRITKSYYDRATDRRKAIRDILEIGDFDRFLRASGYAGGSGAGGYRQGGMLPVRSSSGFSR